MLQVTILRSLQSRLAESLATVNSGAGALHLKGLGRGSSGGASSANLATLGGASGLLATARRSVLTSLAATAEVKIVSCKRSSNEVRTDQNSLGSASNANLATLGGAAGLLATARRSMLTSLAATAEVRVCRQHPTECRRLEKSETHFQRQVCSARRRRKAADNRAAQPPVSGAAWLRCTIADANELRRLLLCAASCVHLMRWITGRVLTVPAISSHEYMCCCCRLLSRWSRCGSSRCGSSCARDLGACRPFLATYSISTLLDKVRIDCRRPLSG